MKNEFAPFPTEGATRYPAPRSGSGRLRALSHQRWLQTALALTSGVLLAVSYVYAPLFMLAWVAFVPLLFAIRDAGLRRSYWLGVVAGTALYAIATYWVVEFLVRLKGYGRIESAMVALLYWVYSAQVMGVVALLYNWVKRTARIPALALFPVIVVVACDAFPTLFTLRLGETQSYFLPALQAVEFTGIHGLDVVVALINVVLFATLVRSRADRWVIGVAAVAIFCWFGYGFYASANWDHRIAAWSRLHIGIVQPNEKSSIDVGPPRAGYARAYPPEMAITAKLAGAGAELALWPETRFKGYFDYAHVRRAFHDELAALKIPVVFQDVEHVHGDGDAREFNTAVFIDRTGRLAGKYRKMRRVAFGEYVPLVSGMPAARSWVQDYFAFHTVSAGSAPAVFRAGRVALVPLICYETAFPQFVAKSLSGRPEGKLLVALSNDTWFGNTREPYMHGYVSIVRAVENRVPLIFALNNGPTLAVAPNGRVLFRSDFQTTAGYVVDLPYAPDSGGSLFNRHPYWFITTLYALLVVALLATVVSAVRARRQTTSTRPP